MRFEVFKGEDGQHYYRAVSNNGQTMCVSESYDSKANARRGANDLATSMAHELAKVPLPTARPADGFIVEV